MPALRPHVNAAFLDRAAEAGVHVPPRQQRGSVVIDVRQYVVTVDGRSVDLSPRQVELLALFVAAPDRLWTRRQLDVICWGDAGAGRRVDVQLCRIRAAVGRDPFRNVRDRGWGLALTW